LINDAIKAKDISITADNIVKHETQLSIVNILTRIPCRCWTKFAGWRFTIASKM